MKKALVKINFRRAFVVAAIISAFGSFVLWDYHRVNRDFSALKHLLSKTRNEAIIDEKVFTAKFNGRNVVVTNGINGGAIKTLNVPTLSLINYDSTIGKDLIVFTEKGTTPYNVRIHGGIMTLKSWFGFKRYIAVNCTGLVTEGRYPDGI